LTNQKEFTISGQSVEKRATVDQKELAIQKAGRHLINTSPKKSGDDDNDNDNGVDDNDY